MRTLIRVAEVWIPDSDGYLLEFGGGVYDNAPDFGATSRKMCFGRGEGLPGRVWEEGRPILLKDLQGGYFQRAAAAKAAHLACAIAFPVFFEEHLKAVVVLFCADDTGQSGAIEIWRNDPRTEADMTLLDGFYGPQDTAFEAVSRRTIVVPGSGLPGRAWQGRSSVFLSAESDEFLRKEAASEIGLRDGFALYCPVQTGDHYVLSFLAAPSLPIATCIESWVLDADRPSLKRAYGMCGPDGRLATDEGSSAGANDAILDAFVAGTPKVRERTALDSEPALVALPFASDGTIVETVAMYL